MRDVRNELYSTRTCLYKICLRRCALASLFLLNHKLFCFEAFSSPFDIDAVDDALRPAMELTYAVSGYVPEASDRCAYVWVVIKEKVLSSCRRRLQRDLTRRHDTLLHDVTTINPVSFVSRSRGTNEHT